MELTLEMIENYANENSVYDAIKYAKTFYGSCPTRINKPYLDINRNTSSEEVFSYAKVLEQYEKDYAIYLEKEKEYQEKVCNVNDLIEEFIKQMACINTVPLEYRDKVYQKAYSEGHSDGYYEVYLKLEKLVEIFA